MAGRISAAMVRALALYGSGHTIRQAALAAGVDYRSLRRAICRVYAKGKQRGNNAKPSTRRD